MSRSKKKSGVVKSGRLLKRAQYNRIVRRTNKQRIKEGKEPLNMREIINVYDIYDYYSFWIEGEMRTVWENSKYLQHYYRSFQQFKRTFFKK